MLGGNLIPPSGQLPLFILFVSFSETTISPSTIVRIATIAFLGFISVSNLLHCFFDSFLRVQETVAPYGTYVKYEGDTPVYTAEEAAYKYNLFKGWDQSGYVNGDKTVNAVFDTCEYVDGY